MSDSTPLPSSDMAGVLRSLVQQQAALLQVYSESVRLQRLLVERCLGSDVEYGVVVAPTEQLQRTSVQDMLPAVTDAPAEPPPSAISVAAPPVLVTAPRSVSVERVPAADATPGAPATGASASRAALYYQQRPAHLTPPQGLRKPQDLELMRRLHEMSDASSLILQFGPFKGATLAQVAIHNPEYIRQLVNRAERPEVRAAACRLVSAIEAAEAHTPRPAGGPGRRTSANRAGPRG